MADFVIARSQNKQVLKDALRRIKRIRFTIGDPDYEKELAAESDPLLACMARFEDHVANVQDMLEIEIPIGSDRLVLRRHVIGATQELKEMENMYAKADALYNTAALKNKKPEKLLPLEDQRNRCRNAFEAANETFEELQKMQAERDAAANVVDLDGKTKKEKEAAKAKTKGVQLEMREPVAPANAGKEQRNLKRAMDILAKSQGMVEDEQDTKDATAEMFENGGFTLASNESTRGQFGKIQSQKREVQTSLKRISEGVNRLHEMAKTMAAEIDNQGKRLEVLENVVQNKQQSLMDLNKRVENLNESMKPLNTCFNVMCFIIVLACVGFLLTWYGVVKL